MHRLIVLFVFGPITLTGCADKKPGDNADLDDTVEAADDGCRDARVGGDGRAAHEARPSTWAT